MKKSFCLWLASKAPISIRRHFYSIAGFHNIGHLSIATKVWSDFPHNVYFSNEGHIGRGTEFHIGYGGGQIIIGKNVWIAPNVHFYCVSHIIGESEKRAGENTYESIEIGDGSWIGADTVVLGGNRVGSGAIITAGSVVVSDVPENEMWGGVPAKFIKEL